MNCQLDTNMSFWNFLLVAKLPLKLLFFWKKKFGQKQVFQEDDIHLNWSTSVQSLKFSKYGLNENGNSYES